MNQLRVNAGIAGSPERHIWVKTPDSRVLPSLSSRDHEVQRGDSFREREGSQLQSSIASINLRALCAWRLAAFVDRSWSNDDPWIVVPADLWRRVDDAALPRLARLPVLLFDLAFAGEDWYTRVARGEELPVPALESTLDRKEAIELARELLMVVWVTAGRDPKSAALISGAPLSLSRQIADLTPNALNRIAEGVAPLLQPRWAAARSFWESLLMAASRDDRDAMHLVRLQSVQLSAAPAREKKTVSLSGPHLLMPVPRHKKVQ